MKKFGGPGIKKQSCKERPPCLRGMSVEEENGGDEGVMKAGVGGGGVRGGGERVWGEEEELSEKSGSDTESNKTTKPKKKRKAKNSAAKDSDHVTPKNTAKRSGSKVSRLKAKCSGEAIFSTASEDPAATVSYYRAVDIYKSNNSPSQSRASSGSAAENTLGLFRENSNPTPWLSLHIGEVVSLPSDTPDQPLELGQIIWIQSTAGQPWPGPELHLHMFIRGDQTVLGEVAAPSEIFFSERCRQVPAVDVVGKVKVQYREPYGWGRSFDPMLPLPPDVHIATHLETSSETSATATPSLPLEAETEEPDSGYYYQKRYNRLDGSFEDPLQPHHYAEICNPTPGQQPRCPACMLELQRSEMNRLRVCGEAAEEVDTRAYYGSAQAAAGHVIQVNGGVYLPPHAFQFAAKQTAINSAQKGNKINPGQDPRYEDEDLYPELYRKKSGSLIKGSSDDTEPYRIGIVKSISKDKKSGKIIILVHKIYRPENTHWGIEQTWKEDRNLVYWTEETAEVSLADIQGACKIVYVDHVGVSLYEYGKLPDCFYFKHAYDAKLKSLIEPPTEAKKMGEGEGKNSKKKGSKKIFFFNEFFFFSQCQKEKKFCTIQTTKTTRLNSQKNPLNLLPPPSSPSTSSQAAEDSAKASIRPTFLTASGPSNLTQWQLRHIKLILAQQLFLLKIATIF
jgi:hypothetical protein